MSSQIIRLLAQFLKSADKKTIINDSQIFIRMNKFANDEFIIKKLILLSNLYEKISEIHKSMDKFMNATEKSIFQGKDRSFKGFKKSILFEKFYYLYRYLVEILPKEFIV